MPHEDIILYGDILSTRLHGKDNSFIIIIIIYLFHVAKYKFLQ